MAYLKQKMHEHLWYYSSLLVVLFLGVIFIIFSNTNIKAQLSITVLVTFFYVLWGIIHHHLDHDLTAKIVVEYVLIGTLGMTIVYFLLG